MKIKNYILAATRNLQEHLTRLLSATVRQVATLSVSFATAFASIAAASVRFATTFVGMATVFVGCVDEIPNPESPEREATFCVRAAWQDGLHSSTTRALTDPAGGEDIVIAPSAYPETIKISCSDGTDFTLTKGSSACANHTEYWNYTPSVIYKDRQIERDNLTFTATATIDDPSSDPELVLGDELVGEAGFSDLHDSHLRITLHHTKALLRFAFQVDSKYDSIRYIKITEIQLNGTPCHLADKVLTTDYQVVAYAYIDTTEVTTSTVNTLQCTYNIYDKDEASEDHITRPNVEAQNSFKLKDLKDFKDPNDPKDLSDPAVLTPGFYYDLLITLDPDYLYTLSDHDEPTDLILH